MTILTYKKKLKVISELFSVPLYFQYNNNTDYDYRGCDAGNKATDILNKTYKPTPEDFKSMNVMVNKLISILSLDESKITKEYISQKLITLVDPYDTSSDKIPFRPDRIWVENYKNLIKFIKK